MTDPAKPTYEELEARHDRETEAWLIQMAVFKAEAKALGKIVGELEEAHLIVKIENTRLTTELEAAHESHYIDDYNALMVKYGQLEQELAEAHENYSAVIRGQTTEIMALRKALEKIANLDGGRSRSIFEEREIAQAAFDASGERKDEPLSLELRETIAEMQEPISATDPDNTTEECSHGAPVDDCAYPHTDNFTDSTDPTTVECPTCNGDGHALLGGCFCMECDGSGRVPAKPVEGETL